MSPDLLIVFAVSALRLAVPLIFAALGEVISERAGVLNMSLEGMMLVSAFGAALGAWLGQDPWLGVLLGLAAALAFAGLQAFLTVTLRADQIVTGLALNIVALGATTTLARAIFGKQGGLVVPGFGVLDWPALAGIPVLGPVLFAHSGFVHLAFGLALLLWLLLHKTSLGLSIRAVGDAPHAADKTGVPVARVRVLAILVTGLAAGLGGMVYAIVEIHTFTENMTSGAGYLAIAAVIFGRWSIWRTVGACLLFGAATALQFQLPAMGIDAPVALLVMLPYGLALLAVAGAIGHQAPPAALTVPFRRR